MIRLYQKGGISIGEYEELLNLIAERMDAEVVEFKTVDEAIEKGISFGILVNTDSYITEEERKQLELKMWINN